MKNFYFLNYFFIGIFVLLMGACTSDDNDSSDPDFVPPSAINISWNLSTHGDWYENGEDFKVSMDVTSDKSSLKIDKFKMLIDGNLVDEVAYSSQMDFFCVLQNLIHGVHEVSLVAVVNAENYLETELEQHKFNINVVKQKPKFIFTARCYAHLECFASNGECYNQSITSGDSKDGVIKLQRASLSWLASNGECPNFEVKYSFSVSLDDDKTICDELRVVNEELHWLSPENSPSNNYYEVWPNPFAPSMFKEFNIYPKITIQGTHEGINFKQTFFTTYKVQMT